MSKGFFKKNEKLILTLFLLILAPSFAFTGIMSQVMQSDANAAIYTVFGESVSRLEFQEIQSEKRLRDRIEAAREPFLQDAVSRLDPLMYYILQREADRLGIVVVGDELAEQVRQAAKDLIAWHQALQTATPQTQMLQLWQQVNQQKQTVRFTLEDYREALDKRVGMKVQDFERVLARGLRVRKLLDSVRESAVVSEREVFNAFEEQEQKRALDLVRIPTESFREAAAAAVASDNVYLKAVFDADPESYTLPERFQIEALKINKAKIEASFSPSDEEITARYEQDKTSLYLANSGFDPFGDPDSSEIYKPLEDVRVAVITSMREGFTEARAKQILEDAAAEAQRRTEAGEGEFPIIDLVPEDQRGNVDVIVSDVFGENDVASLPASILNPPQLQGLFLSTLQAGSFGKEVVPMADGNYIFRVVQRLAPKFRFLQDAREDVIEKATEQKAGELALEYLQGWVDELAKEGTEATFDGLASEANYTVTSFDALGRNDSAKVEIDGERLPSGFNIVRNGFEIPAVGEVGQPLLSNDGAEAYLVRLQMIAKPDTTNYQARRKSLEATTRRDKQAAQEEAFITALRTRAEPREVIISTDETGS